MALIDLATDRPGNADYYSMHLIGSDGAAYADAHEHNHLLLGSTGLQALISPATAIMTAQTLLLEFVAGIRGNRPWSVNLQDTLAALHTVKEATHE